MNSRPRNFIQTVILLIAINFAIICSNVLSFENFHNILDIIAKLLFSLTIYISLQLVFKNTRITHLLLCLIYFPSYTAELFNVLILKQYISFDNLKAVYHTNPTEANEFAVNLLSNIWLPLFIVSILVLNMIFLSKEKVTITNQKKYLIIILIGLLLSFLQQFARTLDSPIFFQKKNLVSITFDRLLKTPPVNIFYRNYQIYANAKKLNKTKAQRNHFNFGASHFQDHSPSKVILIVGEGMRYYNWSINGYDKLTNPKLGKVENLISFQQHYANANNTYKSVPLIITKATPQNPMVAYSEKSIISLYKEAGYKTMWISNQDIFYLDNQEEPDSTILTFKPKTDSDLGILDPFKEIITKYEEENLFVLVNLVGNHGIIPGPFNDHFKPNSSNSHSEISPKNKEKLINDYDNKIIFQDYVISTIINIVQDTGESSVVLFTADHGLNLFDDSESRIFGYGSDIPTKYELHIPLLVWCSETYIENQKNKFDNLIKNKFSYSDNGNVFYTLSDLSGIHFKEFDSTKSLSDDKYIPKSFIPVNINQGYILFDPKPK